MYNILLNSNVLYNVFDRINRALDEGGAFKSVNRRSVVYRNSNKRL